MLDPRTRKVLITRDFSKQTSINGFDLDPQSHKYKLRAFITEGRFNLLLFRVNNIKGWEDPNQAIGEETTEEFGEGIQPLKIIQDGKILLSVFLEENESFVHFQELPQSRYASEETIMLPDLLRCFKNMVAVIYKIHHTKTVIVYQIYQEEYVDPEMTQEERTFISDYQAAGSETRTKKRHRLRKILEVEEGIIADSTLHDVFFLKRDTLCLMIGSDMVICKISNLDQKSLRKDAEYSAEYFKVKIRAKKNRGLNLRKFQLDRINERLYYFHGKTIWKFDGKLTNSTILRYAETIMKAGSIELSGLKEILSELDYFTNSKGFSKTGKRVTSGELSENLIGGLRPSSLLTSSSDDIPDRATISNQFSHFSLSINPII